MHYRTFFKRRIEYSVSETTRFLWSRLLVPILLTIISAFISGAIILYSGGSTAQLSFFTFLPLVILVISTFIFYYIKAPVAFITEAEQVASEIKEENERLLELQQPRLKIVFQKGKEPYERITGSANLYRQGSRLFRIGVKNESNTLLNRCIVKLQKITGNPSSYVPITLKQWHDNPTINVYDANSMDYKQIFALNPNDTEYVDVCQLNEVNVNSQIQLCYARQKGHPWDCGIPRSRYVLTIRAYAEERTFAEEQFSLWIDENGILQFDFLKNQVV